MPEQPSPTQTNTPSGQTIIAAPDQSRRRMIIVIVVLIILWSVTMLFRWEIRARWWVYQLNRAESRRQENYYLARMAAIGHRSWFALDRLINDPRPDIRKFGIKCFQQRPLEFSDKHLYSLLDHKYEDVAAGAAWALTSHRGIPRTLETLQYLILDTPPDNRNRNAVYCLERIGGSQAEEILIEALAKTNDPDLLAQIIDSLGMLASKKAGPSIEKMLSDHRPITILPVSHRQIQQAIMAIQGQQAIEDVNNQDLLDTFQIEPTVAAVAKRSLQMINAHKDDQDSQ
ncbi:MAG: HEAT repeat domain-containing protein [Planctomycetota bacterium]|nr:MAG: HEAT repeat domain-containing protein [Planctomycetota bacterium]